MDPLNTETSCFWQNHGEENDVKQQISKLKFSVYLLPVLLKRTALLLTQDAGYNGTGKVLMPPGIALPDGEILSGIFPSFTPTL